MSADIVGSIVAKVGYDTTGLRKGERETEQSLKRVDDSIALTSRNSEKLTGHLGGVGAALGALAGYKVASALTHGLEDTIQKASDLNETMSKTKVIFGSAFDQVDRFAQGSAKSIGLSRQAAEEAAATYGNLFVNIGLGQAPAARMSTALVQLAGDLASLNNTPVQDALDALRSGLVGEVEPLRRYGVSLDDATLRQEALKLGLVSTTKDALQPAVRAQAAYAAILDRTKTAQGDFARTSGSNANQLKTLQAEADNAKASLGQGLLPVQVSLLHAANDLTPALNTVAQAVGAVGSNDDARHTVEIVGGVAAALYGLNKAITISKAIRDSEIFTLLRGTAAREASTAAIIAEGDAAAAAAAKVAGLDAAEAAGGGKAGGGRLLGRFAVPAALGAVGGAALAVAPLLLTGGDAPNLKQSDISKLILDIRSKQKNDEGLPLYDKALKLREGQPFVQSRGIDKSAALEFLQQYGDPAEPKVGAALESLGYVPPKPAPFALNASGIAAGSLANTQSALAKAHAAASDPNAIKSEAGIIGGVFGGMFDEVAAPTTRGDVAGAQDKLTSATDRVKSAQDRLEQSQRRLSDLRASGKASTTQLADAEDRLAAARRNLDAASRGAGKAEDALNKAKQPTALSAKDALDRITGQARHASELASANNKLVAAGLSRPVIEGLDQLDKEAPGTIARVASGLTPALVKALNREQTRQQQAEHTFLTAPLRAAERAAMAENERAAAAYAQAYANALQRHMAALDLPLPVGVRPSTSHPVTGRPLVSTPADHEGRTAQATTTIHMPNATIVANDPKAMAAELDRQTRINRLAGKE